MQDSVPLRPPCRGQLELTALCSVSKTRGEMIFENAVRIQSQYLSEIPVSV